MKKYTVGFIFNSDLSKVLLVHKTAPAWQVGKINGVGGKREVGEGRVKCIIREIREETGIEVEKSKIYYTGVIKDSSSIVDVFGVLYEGEVFEAFVFEKEKIEWFSVLELPKNIIPNLRWLIPLCLERVTEGKIRKINVEYREF